MIDQFYLKQKHGKVKNILPKLYNKKEYTYTDKKFKVSIKSWISIKKVHRVIKLNHEA